MAQSLVPDGLRFATFSETVTPICRKLSMTYKQRLVFVLACLLTWSSGVYAAPVEISGVRVEDPITLHGSKLLLNGAGVRYKAVFKVYVAAVYVGIKASTPEEVYAAPGPKRLSITLLRDIDSSEIGKTFAKAIEGPSLKGEMARFIPNLIEMEQNFAAHEKLLAGENFTIDWVPGTGTVLTLKGKPRGEPFKEIELFNTLIGIWLGPFAADWKLRDALLGKTF